MSKPADKRCGTCKWFMRGIYVTQGTCEFYARKKVYPIWVARFQLVQARDNECPCWQKKEQP